MAIKFFMTRSWIFNNEKLLSLRSKILLCDKNEFNLDGVESMNFPDYFTDCIKGSRIYLLKETPDTIPKAREHNRR